MYSLILSYFIHLSVIILLSSLIHPFIHLFALLICYGIIHKIQAYDSMLMKINFFVQMLNVNVDRNQFLFILYLI